ncbi:MAG: hypothetical protein ACPLYD_16070 [Anaerolineae bacterium]
MDEFRTLLAVILVIPVPLWMAGFWGQRLGNTGHLPDWLYIKSKRRWAVFLGVRSWRGEKIYLGPALIQTMALLYTAVISIIVGIWGSGVLIYTIIAFGVSFVPLSIVLHLFKKKIEAKLWRDQG